MTLAETALTIHRSSPEPTTLLADVDRDLALAFAKETGFAALARTGKAPEELWAFSGDGALKLIVFAKKRTARETYRVLCLAERLVANSGTIILPATANARAAVDTFLSIYDQWMCEGTSTLRKLPAKTPALKRVVSLSLFGTNEHYWRCLPIYVRAHHALFPGYELRIHHDDAIYRMPYGDVLHGLARRGLVKLVRVAPDGVAIGKCLSMLWRLLPAWDPEVDIVLCRDADSIPTWRERCAVEEFVAGGYTAGTIHDDNEHTRFMGGLSHFRVHAFREAVGCATFSEFIATAGTVDWNAHGSDQAFLNALAPKIPSILEHSLFTVEGEGGALVRRSAPTIDGAELRTAITEPPQDVIENVYELYRKRSDAFTNYIGAAGYRTEEARRFYDEECVTPTTAEIQEAERFAGWHE